MQNQHNNYISKDLVLIGGGHSHVEVLRQFGMNPIAGLRITVISKDIDAPYSGMMPGLIAGHYQFEQAHIDLGPLARFSNAQFIHASVNHIDTERKIVSIENRPSIHYDYLSINIGSQPDARHVPGANRYTLPVKPIDNFLNSIDTLTDKLRYQAAPFHLAIVGGGVSSIEVALAYQHKLATILGKTPQNIKNIIIKIITSKSEILSSQTFAARKKLTAILEERNIQIVTDTVIEEITETHLISKQGASLVYDDIIWATNAAAQPWLKDTSIKTDDDGFILVNQYLQSQSNPDIFAAGDIASSLESPRPKSGVFAVRQGPILSENIRGAIVGHSMKPFRPQRTFLTLIGTGDEYAIATKGIFTAKGKWAWHWKKSIDQKFMHKYNDIQTIFMAMHQHNNALGQPAWSPKVASIVSNSTESSQAQSFDPQSTDTQPPHQMRCGGCAAKVESDVLINVIKRIKTESGSEHCEINIDDASIIDVPQGYQLVQSVDYFRTFIDDIYSFGKIAANHALGDLYAMGAKPHSALAIATIPYLAPDKTEETLYQLMSGAASVINDSGAELTGGHTGEGSELCFGLTVNGFTKPETLMKKGGLAAGDFLILTKPLGTGMLLAADMQLKARGRHVLSAITSMMQSNQAAADIFTAHNVKACTDITGFGLLGHLIEMLNASRAVKAEITIEELPLLDGIKNTIEKNIVSTLHHNNRKSRKAIINQTNALAHPLSPILFDPQTAGGLLASVKGSDAQIVLRELNQAGFHQARIIGRVLEAEALSSDIRTNKSIIINI